jgi:hypothetical protein
LYQFLRDFRIQKDDQFGRLLDLYPSNGRVIIEGTKAFRGRPLSKGMFWELHTSTTKPPGVTLVDMEMNEELSKKKHARIAKKQSEYCRRKRGGD